MGGCRPKGSKESAVAKAAKAARKRAAAAEAERQGAAKRANFFVPRATRSKTASASSGR